MRTDEQPSPPSPPSLAPVATERGVAEKTAAPCTQDKPLGVAELNRRVRFALERGWAEVWVQGELSDVTLASSGHAYFTLNDGQEAAQIRCVMFRGDFRKVKAPFKDGQVVKVRGTLSLYEPRGSFQLIARAAVAGGQGDLHAEFERIKKLLAAEGLLDVARKRPLPRFPRVIGVVTSTSGAALHDILRVTEQRCPVRVVVAGCQVQGALAPASIVDALHRIQKLADVEVIIVGRGGGAAEDLFAFNSEVVARAIAGCRVPIVSAVGHEVDITIADLVADVRAATPSNAAELAVPEHGALCQEVQALRRGLERALEVQLGRHRLRLDRSTHRLMDPRRALAGVRSRLESSSNRVAQAMRALLRQHRSRQHTQTQRLLRLDARRTLAQNRAAWASMQSRLVSLGKTSVVPPKRALLGQGAAHLHALSPLGILARGYAIALLAESGKALTSSTQTRPGDRVRLLLHEGQVSARIEDVDPVNQADTAEAPA